MFLHDILDKKTFDMFNKSSKLYAIADQETCLENDIEIIDFIQILYKSGIQIVQYRNKLDNMLFAGETFDEIIEKTNNEMIYIINDHEKIATRYLAHDNLYLHAGQTDTVSIREMRFGRSTHNVQEVASALKENPQPEYIGFGAMFDSSTKPGVPSSLDQVSKAMELWKEDLVLIGGITSENITQLPKSDHIYYAILSDFFTYGNEPQQIEKRVKELLSATNIS